MITRAITVNPRVSNTSNVLNIRKNNADTSTTFGMLLTESDLRSLIRDQDGVGDVVLKGLNRDFYLQNGDGPKNKAKIEEAFKKNPQIYPQSRLSKAVRIVSKWVF